MLKYYFIIFSLILLSCSPEIVINEKGFGKFKVGETSIKDIKSGYNKFKEKKSFRHVLYRTDEGRIGITYYYQWINVRNYKISFLFISSNPTSDSSKLKSITFNKRSKGVTENGIRINKSTFEDITNKYGKTETIEDNNGGKHKFYEGIEFYSDNYNKKDTSDKHIIVTRITIEE